MISQVGEDAFGTHILKTLHANGVNISTVFRTGRANTALAFVSLDKNGNREFSFYRNPSADLFLDEAQITPDIFVDCAVLHFCSVDLVDAPVKQAHRKAIRLAKDAARSSRLILTCVCRCGAARKAVRQRFVSFCRMQTS